VARSFKTVVSVDDQASASSEAIRTKVAGDSAARMSVDAGGKITWGAGSASGDVTLYRSAANTLKTDDTLVATTGIVTLATDGAPSTALANGALAVDTTNHAFYFRSNSTWNQVSGGGASITIQDGAPSSPSAGDLWFESDTGKTLVRYDDGAGVAQWVEIGHSVDSSTVDLNLDGGLPNSNYGGVAAVDGGAP
tara:strand:- start:716 stop:1297 length:582 start_codon:yes stop_codon:yes gene_type:complete